MIGQTISHYRIIERLGEGGMGVVYKAQDTHLDRPVALKFLPPHLCTNKDARSRFIQEAKSASSIDHTNICTILDIDETDDNRLFIAMTCYDGESLKDKIGRGPLPIEEAVDYAIQIAQGLSLAHEAGIIHRDIKPGNVMITQRGVVKIVDFGLAKMAETSLTKTGKTLGTAMYMSPEQARGEKVDHATDIWSLGVVLYEMLTGKQPFFADYDAAVLYQVVNEKPTSLGALQDDIPGFITDVVGKCLEKDQAQRYQSMLEISAGLSTQTHTSKLKTKKSIIVLPFVNMSPDPDQEYFSDGLTEEIITDLSHVGDLLVISRNSAMTFKGTKKKTREIARDVNVTYVLEGSVRKAGNNLRITAQLIDATTDTHLWAEKYRGTLDDVFDIQENVSRSIVESLKARLSPKEDKKITEHPIENVQAYECYLRARQEISRLSEDGLNSAKQLIQTGLNIIGENEVLNATLGYIYVQIFNVGNSTDESYLQKAKDYANKAFILNPYSAHAHSVMGQVHWKLGYIQRAKRDLVKAIEINPNNPDPLLWLSWIYITSGKAYAARPVIKRLLEIDPLNPQTYVTLANSDLFDGKFDTSLQSYHTAYEIDPNNEFYGFAYGWALLFSNRFNEAIRIFNIFEEHPNVLFSHYVLLYKHALQNNKTGILHLVTDEMKANAKRDEIYPIMLADCFSIINEPDEAINWLEYGIKWGFINYPFLNEHDPFLENIRGEPRFKKLMERVKYEWERFEV